MAVLAELALFLLPFAAFALWRRFKPGAEPSRAALWLAAAGILLGAAAAAWYGLGRRLDRDAAYVPARMENGDVVPGGGAAPR